MPQIQFTPEELYLINAIKSQGRFNSFVWGYLSGAALLCTLAYLNQSMLLFASGFVVVLGCRLYEEYYTARWHPLWQSIIAKFERASSNAGDQP